MDPCSLNGFESMCCGMVLEMEEMKVILVQRRRILGRRFQQKEVLLVHSSHFTICGSDAF